MRKCDIIDGAYTIAPRRFYKSQGVLIIFYRILQKKFFIFFHKTIDFYFYLLYNISVIRKEKKNRK